MRRRDQLRVVMLGALEPLEAPTVSAVRAAGPRALEILQWQKSLALAGERLGRLAEQTGDAVVARLHGAVADAADAGRRRAAALAEADARVVELAATQTYLMKGLAFQTWYADPAHRHVGDLDLWIPDVDGAWALTAALRRDGWTYQDSELPWLKRDLRSGELYGQIRLWAGTERRPDVYVDIHYGPFYSVRHCGVMRLAPPRPGRILDPADNLAAMVGNAANDHFVTVKDVNDLYLALGRDDVDWDRFVSLVRSAEVERFLVRLVERLRRIQRLDQARLDRLRALGLPRRGEHPAPSLVGWSVPRRWLVTVAHAARTAHRTPGLSVPRTAGTAAYHYARTLPLRVVDSVRRPVRAGDADNATCVRLVPYAQVAGTVPTGGPDGSAPPAVRPLVGSRSVEVGSAPHGDVIRCGTDVFLPTVNYAVDRRVVRAGDALRATRIQDAAGDA